MNIKEIRYKNVRSLVKKMGKLALFADKIGKAPAQASSFAGEKPRKGIGDDMAEHIEKCFDLPRGWMDKVHDAGEKELSDSTKLKGIEAGERFTACKHLTAIAVGFDITGIEDVNLSGLALIKKLSAACEKSNLTEKQIKLLHGMVDEFLAANETQDLAGADSK